MDSDKRSTLICRIYQILFNHSDVDHPLKQQDICNYLNKEYQMECTRQAIARNIQSLMEMGIDIEQNCGYYLESRPLEKYELILLIDSVLGSRHISAQYSKELINKLINLGGENFKHDVKHVYIADQLKKTTNKDFFYNIEVVNEAIDKEKKISFDYRKFVANGEQKISKRHIASPYQLILHNQHYYLILRDEEKDKIGFYRMDKICNIKLMNSPAYPLKDNPEFKNGIDYERYSTGMPYLFNDELKTIQFRCNVAIVDQLYDWFEGSIKIVQEDEKHLLCTIKTSEDAMLYWALQYNNNIEILSPNTLRDRMIQVLQSTLNLYK